MRCCAVVGRLLVLNFGRKIAEGEPRRGDGLAARCARSISGSPVVMALLETRDLTAFYGDFQALFGIDTDARRGRDRRHHRRQRRRQVDATCKPIAGLIRSDAPTASVFDGQPIGALPAAEIVELGIAMVPEGRRLFPSLTSRRIC